MKVIKQTSKLLLTNLLLFFLFYLLFENINNWIVTVFPDYGDLEDWWYNFTQYGYASYLLGTVFLSGAIFLLWKLSLDHARSACSLICWILIGTVGIRVAYEVYWSWLEAHAFGFNTVLSIDECFCCMFGSCDRAVTLLWTATCIVFAIGVLLCRFGYFFREPVKRMAMLQAASREPVICSLICRWIPVINIGAGVYYWGLLDLPIDSIFFAITAAVVLWRICIVSVQFIRMKNYYRTARNASDTNGIMVIFKEAKIYERASVYHDFLKNEEIMEVLSRNNIYMLPSQLVVQNVGMCIVLDVCDEIIAEPPDKQHVLIEELLQLRGTFNVAYCASPGKMGSLKKAYDYCDSDPEMLVRKTVELSGVLAYRVSQRELISQLRFDSLSSSSMMIVEIISFKAFFDRYTSKFQVFDYCIKWLEIVNYLYGMIAVSEKEISVSADVLEALDLADFARWRKIQQDMLQDCHVSCVMDQPCTDHCIFETFRWVWNAVTNRDYLFEDYSIKELLAAANRLRDYTRGHGVFTFEISSDINLALIKMLVFLINQLIDRHLLDRSCSNLDGLGWVIYSGDDPYFLYSSDNDNAELRFDSFKNGNSLTMPVDIRGDL